MEDRGTRYADIVKLFSFALNQYRLYSEKHPASQGAVRNFLGKLDPCFSLGSALSFGVAEGKLIVNDLPVDEKKIGVGELVREYQRLQIGSLIFEKGVTENEISSFFQVMAIPPKIVEERGGFSKIFEEANFPHIRLGAVRYMKVEEEEEVVLKSEIPGDGEGIEEGEKGETPSAEPVRKIERMEDLVEYCLKEPTGKIDLDIDRLTYEVEKRPEIVARQMVQRAESPDLLRRTVKRIAVFLLERLSQPWILEGRDFSQVISRLAKELKKAMESPEASSEFEGAVPELVGILEECADAVRLETVVQGLQQDGVHSLAKIIGKFLRSAEVRDRLLEPLTGRLISLGIAKDDLGKILAKVQGRTPARKSRQVDVSDEELADLRRLRERFEEELARRLKEEITALDRERRRALEEKERVEAIIRNVAEGLVVVDVDGKIQFMNPAAEKLLGMSQAAGKGVPIPNLLKDEHLLALARGRLLDEGDSVTKVIELQSRNDETRRILQASTAVIENVEGKTVGMVSVLSDITQKKRLDEAKSKFVAHVSHELRTPLVAIDESLAILLRNEVGTVNPEQEKFLSIARRNIGRLSRLVNDLLDIAKLEAGKLGLNVMSFQVNDMVHHVVETVRSWAGDKRLTIEEKYPETNLVIEADADRLIQVVTNLLGNAVKFTPEGGRILVEVNPQWKDAEISREPCLAISVHDSGVGIPKEDQHRIFDKFEQANLSAGSGVISTGLGLTIAKEIVALHGGKIWVESEEGTGSRFTFAIPRRLRNAVDPARV